MKLMIAVPSRKGALKRFLFPDPSITGALMVVLTQVHQEQEAFMKMVIAMRRKQDL